MPERPDDLNGAAEGDAATDGIADGRHGTLPGVPPAPPLPEFLLAAAKGEHSAERLPDDPPDDDEPGMGFDTSDSGSSSTAVSDGSDDEEELELTDDADLEEVDSGELLAQSQPALPVGGEGLSGPVVAPPAPPEEPPAPSALDLAVAEATGGDWARRAAELRVELEAETDRARTALLAYELGELSERRLRDEAGAVKAFGRALQSDPSLRANLWAIRRVFYRRSLWPNLLKLIDAEVRFARNDHERADLLVEKAHILEDRLADAGTARESYERAIALDGAHLGALLGRERQALTERDNETLLRVWRLLADASSSPARKAGYLVDRARLLAALALAGSPEQASGTLQEALDVIAEAGGLAGSPGVDPELVARERERLAEMSGDPEDLLAAGDVRVTLLARDGNREREIVALRRRQARVARGRGDRAAALRYLQEAAALAPDEPLLCYDLADLGEEAGADNVVAMALDRLGELCGDTSPQAGAALALRRADAFARAGDDDQANAVREELRVRSPGFLPLVAHSGREAIRAGDKLRLAALRLEESTAARAGTSFGPGAAHPAQPSWAAAAATSAGDVLAIDLGRDDEARAAYEQALDMLPGYPYAVEGLVSLHLAGGRPDEGARILERESGTATGVRADEMLERLAALYETMGMLGDAQRSLERLLARRPDDSLSLHRLERLHATAGNHEARVALLGRIAERAADPVRKAAIFFEIARVKEDALNDPAGAIEAYRMTLALDPHDRIVRGALLASLRRAGRWDELAGELRLEASLAEGAGASRALRGAAAILARRLERLDDAAAVYRELADRAPDDPAAARGLASALQGSPEEAAPVLEREIALLGEGKAAAEALVRLGDLFDGLGRDEDAASAYRRAAELGDGGAEGVGAHAAWALAELSARRGDRRALAEALGGIAGGTSDDVVRGDLLEELAWLSSDDVEEAAGRFAEVAARAPERRGAQLGKALLAARRNDAPELAAALIAQAGRTSDPRVAGALLLRAAAIKEVMNNGGEGGSEQAARLSASALELLPDDAGTLVAAVERSMPEQRAALLGRRAALSTDPESLAELHLGRGETLEREGRLADAGRAFADALAAVPGHLGALYGLRRLARRAGDHETMARASYQLGGALADPGSAAAHYAEAAALLDGDLGRPDQAARVWRRVFELTPEHPTAFKRAHELLVAADDVPALIALLGKKIASLGPSGEVARHRMERAALLRRKNAQEAAADDLEAVLELEPARVDAMLALAEVRLSRGDARGAAELLGQYNETVTEPEQRAEGELRLARVYEEIGDRAGAISAYEMVLTARSDDLPARERLIELLLTDGAYARAGEEMERLAERRPEKAARARDELRAARVYRDHVGDARRARTAYERALSSDPLGLEALRELAAITEGSTRTAVLERAAGDVRALVIATRGTEAQPIKVLAAAAALAGDDTLAFSACGALEALGAASDEERRRYLAERGRSSAAPLRPRRAISEEEWRSRVEHPGVRGAIGDAWACVAEGVARLAGDGEPAGLGFGKSDRVAWKALGKTAPAVEAAVKIAGLGEIDLWVTAARTAFARAVPLEVPLVLLSADVARADTPDARALLGRTAGAAHLRSGPLEEISVEDLALTLLAGFKAAGGDASRAPALAPHAAAVAAKVDERSRQLGRVMSRKDRKTLGAILDKGTVAGDLSAWLTAVKATTRRVALLLSGDVPLVLGNERARGGVPSVIGADLIAYSVSESFLYLRKDLGLANS